MAEKTDKEYIQIVQGVGETLGLGPISIKQIPIVGGSFGTVMLLNIFLNVGLFTCLLLGTWLAATGWIVIGETPYRFLNRLFSKTHNWIRGFEPTQPLLNQNSDRS
jgi:hypothetical protein